MENQTIFLTMVLRVQMTTQCDTEDMYKGLTQVCKTCSHFRNKDVKVWNIIEKYSNDVYRVLEATNRQNYGINKWHEEYME